MPMSVADSLETRHHELRRTRVVMVDGSLTVNSRVVQRGLSARAAVNGYWGFASMPMADEVAGAAAEATAGRERVRMQALRNARAMARFGSARPLAMPSTPYRGQHAFSGRPPMSAAEVNDRLQALHAWCRTRYPGIRSTRIAVSEEHHQKQLETDAGGDSLASIQRAALMLTLIGEDADGQPIEVSEIGSAKGHLGDLDWSIDSLAPKLDRAHEHLQAKRHAVTARGGLHTVVLAPDLAGMLAHEAMGHPCEADAVLGGAITGRLVGQAVASELVSMVDYAHSINGREAMCPVYVDDEGTPARDVVMIDRGRLTGFMHSRETAARMGQAPTGSARAYSPDDEPLIRMRNTGILPGTSTYAELIEGVDDGYLLLKTGNGQADSTTEFTFGVTLAYEIKSGRIGRAVRNTTLSGSALEVLKAVDGVSDDDVWTCSGYCGKKQPMVVSMGGPALRTRAHLGGE
jgi:TldD protein